MRENLSQMPKKERRDMALKEIAMLLESGYALTSRDFAQAYDAWGMPLVSSISATLRFGEYIKKDNGRNLRVERYKHSRIITDRKIPLEDTDIEEVKKEIDSRLNPNTGPAREARGFLVIKN